MDAGATEGQAAEAKWIQAVVRERKQRRHLVQENVL